MFIFVELFHTSTPNQWIRVIVMDQQEARERIKKIPIIRKKFRLLRIIRSLFL